MSIQAIGTEAIKMFEVFGWYSVLLVLGTTLLMIPVNELYKLIMKKESLQRLRKTISTISVFGVAIGVIALFTAMVTHHPITFNYLLASSLPCGFLAQGLWVIIKLTRDYGWTFVKWLFAKIFKTLASNKAFKKSLINLGINKSIVDVIADEILSIKVVDMSAYLKQEGELTAKLRTVLTGFVSAENIGEAVKICLDKVKSTIKVEKAPVEVK